jgi:hypothetical protein
MEGTTATGETKMEAVTDAFEAFVSAPESAGIGMALTFFPIERLDVPEVCASDAECGERDACFEPDVCLPSAEAVCRTDADCTIAGDRCEPLGICAGSRMELCLPGGGFDCSDGARCIDYGYCENRTDCDVAAYARPAVDVGTLPGAGRSIVTAMRSRVLGYGTPTLPALRGVLSRAAARTVESPGSKVIVILATDGFPTACDETIDLWRPDPSAGIDSVARAAAVGVAGGIQTFVIGVFSPDEELDARRNFAEIAAAGGTGEALVITTEEPVTERLIAVLDELRRSVRTCVYAIPHAGVVPDPRALEVVLVGPGGRVVPLERRDGPTDCDAASGGFYFEQDIEEGARPGYVEICPESCALLGEAGFRVEMRAGCTDV